MSYLDTVQSILEEERKYIHTDDLIRGLLVALAGILEEQKRTRVLLSHYIDEISRDTPQ